MNFTLLVPVHNEEENIDIFYHRTLPILTQMPLQGWEMVFLNNASTDGTLDKLRALRKSDPRVKILTFSRNIGYQASLVAGLSNRESDLYAIVDVDGEDPPELLATFFEKIQNGAQTVYGIRSQRDEPKTILFFRGLFYWINRKIADSPVIPWMAEFAMIRRNVRDLILANRSTFPFLRAEIGHVGLGLVGVPYFRANRKNGISHYNFLRMTQFAVAGFLSSSTFPLRAVLYMSAGTMVSFVSLVLIRGRGVADASHWAVLFLFFYLMTTVPCLALYLARVYKNGVARPSYIVDPNRTYLE